jgi:uncharacterized phiE125 gp8 family phage protein
MYDLSRRPIPSFVLKTPPAIEPIGIDEVKAHSRIDLNEDDLLIQRQILTARHNAERVYDIAIITQTWTMYLEWLPYDCIEIFKIPLQSVTSVKYTDADGLTQTIPNNLYMVDLNSRPPRIVRVQDASWPYVQPRPRAVAVELVAGYGDKCQDVPPNVTTYLLYKVGDLYENRETYSELKLQKFDFADSLMATERLFSSV